MAELFVNKPNPLYEANYLATERIVINQGGTYSSKSYSIMQVLVTMALENKGWEIALGYRNKVNEFNYGITLSVNDNRNKITNLNGLNSQDRTMVEGYPNGGIWGYLSDGYYQNNDDVANSPKLSGAARPGFLKYKKVFQGEGVDPMLIDQ
jgi:hypothetical protein